MLATRIIPCLLLSGQGLVKTERFRNPKYVGDPINAVKIFNAKEVDELILLDISVRRDRRGIQFKWIEEIATEAFMPVGYGGGIDSLEDIRRLFDLGVEKVVLNTAAARSSDLISAAVADYGSQSVVVSVDVKKSLFGRYEVVTDCGRVKLKRSLGEYLAELQFAGAGEIFLTSVDQEGTQQGYDLDLISKVANAVKVPVVANGGAGQFEDFKLAKKAGASAAAAGSMFVFHGKFRAVLISYPPIKLLEELDL